MKVGLISDSHDDEQATKQALTALDGVDEIIHSGDLCAPFMIDLLDEAEKPVHAVFGNVDDRHLTTKVSEDADHVVLHGNEASLEKEGVQIYVTHFPDIAELAAKSGEYDVVVHGHTHEQRQKQFGDTVLVNPGELLGRKEKRGYAVLNTANGSVSLRRLDES
jgi:putative phosphoesterase